MESAEYQLVVLSNWIENAPYRLARRAWLVLEYLKGQSTKSLASTVAMTEQRVVDVIYRYIEWGLIGLFDLPRSGKPSVSWDEEVGNSKHDKNLSGAIASAREIARRLNISPDTVWREARIANVAMDRVRQRVLNTRTELTRYVPLLGCVVGPHIQILAVSQDIKSTRMLKPSGTLDSVSEELSNLLEVSEKLGELFWLELVIQLGAIVSSRIPTRVALERRLRFVDRIDHFEMKYGSPFKIYLSGDIRSEAFQSWVKALQRSKFWLVGDKDRYNLFISFRDSIRHVLGHSSDSMVQNLWLNQIPDEVSGLQEELVWYRATSYI
jgi:hypothetical protein